MDHTVDGEMSAFWNSAGEGVLLVPKCDACGKAHWYPRPFCPFCASQSVTWHRASGRGTIYSYSVLRRSAKPFCIAYVTLEEGPTMLTNILASSFDAVRVGEAVKVQFDNCGGERPMPAFTLASSGSK
jgi:uncharacterized OB-fold protein